MKRNSGVIKLMVWACAGMAGKICTAQDVSREELRMYLCADSMAGGKSGGKLVYGFINDQKTACMQEYEFLALYNQARFEKDSTARTREHAEAIERTKKGVSAASMDSIVVLIRAGKKELDESDLMGVNLEGADLRGASFISADLRRAKLAKADLSGANLQSAFLKRADLRGAKLDGTNLKGAYLAEADLRQASGLTVEALKDVTTLFKAKLDAELIKQVAYELADKLKAPSKCWENNRWSDNEDCNPKKGLENPEKAK